MQNLQHVFGRQRLEIEAVGRVIVGRHGFRVAVDHDRLIAGFAQRKAGMDAAIVELDTLADAVGTTAQDDDLLAVAGLRLILRLAEDRGFIGRIHVGRLRLELGGAGVDALEHRTHAQLVAQAAHLVLGHAAGHGDDGIVDQAAAARHAALIAAQIGRLERQPGETLVGKAHGLEAAHAVRIARQAMFQHLILGLDDFLQALQEPGVELGDIVDFRDGQTFTKGLRGDQQTIGRRLCQGGDDVVLGRADQMIDLVEAGQAGFQTAQRLLHRFMDVAADRHDFADRLHGGAQQRLGALELFEGEARDLGHDIVDRRFERSRGRAGNVILDLVERVADGQLRRDLGDREAGRLRRQRRGARHARVHLDDDQAAVLGIDRELDVRPAGFDADLAQHRQAGVAHDLIFLVGQRQRRRDGDGVAGVDAHRIDILDRADDDGIVVAITHDFHLIFLPAEERFLDQDFGGRRSIQPAADDVHELVAIIGDTAAGAAHGEAGADDRRKAGELQRFHRLFHGVGDARAGRFQADLVHGVAELDPVLRLVDRLGVGADHLDTVLLQRAVVEQRQRRVQRGLAAHRRQHRIGPLLLDDLRHDFGRDRLDIGRVGKFRIGHDGGRVGIHQDDAIALFLQRLDRLRARIIELARLADDDRTSADDEDGGDVCALGHYLASDLQLKALTRTI